MAKPEDLANVIKKKIKDIDQVIVSKTNEVVLTLQPLYQLQVLEVLKTDPDLAFEILIDLSGIDYLHYGNSEWQTDKASSEGFSRGVSNKDILNKKSTRFAVIYHLLSITHNQRLRVCLPIKDEALMVESVINIWQSANWYEREAFDLYGILFKDHPDLRRILTDYGFVGHPMRKDFPLIGEVEMRYDKSYERVVYEPVSISPRVLVPKVIRQES